MQALHARYPFLSASREAVEQAGVDLGELVAEGGPAVDRGRARVERALTGGTVEPDPGAHWSTRAELLSYPVARVLVSLLDVPGAVEKYAAAEARVAHDRFVADVEHGDDLRSDRTARVTLRQLLADFDLAERVRPVLTDAGAVPDRYEVAVATYLRLAADLPAADWRLVARPLSDGRVPVERGELYTLLREAVRERVEDGLPLSVPEPVAAALAEPVADLRSELADVEVPTVDRVVPELFPPCIAALAERARDPEAELADHSRFTLLSFLAGVGLEGDGAAELLGLSGEAAAAASYGMARLRDDREAQFPPPTCETMKAYGDCTAPDERCEELGHPLAYYDERLAATEGRTDWRER